MNSKVYISDEGFGPIVRQRAIIEEIQSLNKNIKFTVQTERHLQEAKRLIPGVGYQKRYNNITWHKTASGNADIEAIQTDFEFYFNRSERFFELEKDEFKYDFIISDFVYEAFQIANHYNIPSFGVAHFTWDWFFAKLYPPPLKRSLIDFFIKSASLAEVLYFPPFTPIEILNLYKKKVKEVPFILNKNISHKVLPSSDKFRVMIMDSGSGVLQSSLTQSLRHFHKLSDIEFFISSSFKGDYSNVSYIDKNDLFIDYIDQMDLVIGRAGFNTISECIALRTPMLLLSEAINPEMNENIIKIKQEGLGSFISLETFTQNLHEYLPRFISHEYKNILQNMNDHNYQTNGAKVIAEDILSRVIK